MSNFRDSEKTGWDTVLSLHLVKGSRVQQWHTDPGEAQQASGAGLSATRSNTTPWSRSHCSSKSCFQTTCGLLCLLVGLFNVEVATATHLPPSHSPLHLPHTNHLLILNDLALWFSPTSAFFFYPHHHCPSTLQTISVCFHAFISKTSEHELFNYIHTALGYAHSSNYFRWKFYVNG